MEFSRPEYCIPFPSPADLPNPGVEPRSPKLQVDYLPAEPQWNLVINIVLTLLHHTPTHPNPQALVEQEGGRILPKLIV